MKILLVEDDEEMGALLAESLAAHHYTVDLASDGQVALQFANQWEYDLILLDLLIPKLDGIEFCRQLRSQGHQTPILLQTAQNDRTQIVAGLDAGADDYLIKPYHLDEMLARVRALLRRGRSAIASPVLTWGELRFDPISAQVSYGDRSISLTPKEYSLLELFLRNPQRAFSRSAIIDRLWSIDTTPSEGAVTNLIKDLRQKLKTAGMTVDLLETVYGLGYRVKKDECKPKGNSHEVSESYPQGVATSYPPEGATPPQTICDRSAESLEKVNQVLQQYKGTFIEQLTVLEQAEVTLRSQPLTPEQRQIAQQEAHKLAGGLGTFGYAQGSDLAQVIEQLLQQKILSPSEISQLAKKIIQIKQELTQSPTSLTLLATPIRTQVLVIDHNRDFIQELQQEMSIWGMQIAAAIERPLAGNSKRSQDQQQIFESTPDVILLNLNLPDLDGKTFLQDLKVQFPTIPILVFAAQDSLNDRVAVARLGAQGFLCQPTVKQIFEAIEQVLPSQSATARVMIVDDDATMLELFTTLLQPWGFQIISLQDPQQFWQVLTTTAPDLLILDLEMPTFSGVDLCQVVRQDAVWGDLPILVVTAHREIATIQQVFAAGADDFICKPIVGPELVTRVISRIDRHPKRKKNRNENLA
ncbi:response regulator [Phormidesmis priestleyi]